MTDERETVIKGLANEMQGWNSIEFHVFHSLEQENPTNDPWMFTRARFSELYIEKATGERFYECDTLEPLDSAPLSRYFCDGAKCADWTSTAPADQNRDWVYIKEKFGIERTRSIHFCPLPLKLFYYGPLPLYQALIDSTYLGRETHLDRECEIFLLKQVDQERKVCCLDRETSIPLAARYYSHDTDPAENRPSSVWNALSLESVDGHFFPMESELIGYRYISTSDCAVARRKYVVDHLKFDQEYPQSIFWPVISPTTVVIDALAPRPTATGG